MSNKKICCNVCDCCHNQKGCECGKEEIDVSCGCDNNHHYCSSYQHK